MEAVGDVSFVTKKNDENSVFVELFNVKKDYIVNKKPFTAVKGVNLALPKKGFVAVLGESGSGKTTLLNIIGGLDHYTSGDLKIEGQSTKDFTSKDWDAYRNTRCGFVFQSYHLLARENVLHNVTLSLRFAGVSAKKANARAKELLKAVGLSRYTKKKPNQLSGGQAQRVAIARALGNNPDIILADEPTGALDSSTSLQIMKVLKELSAERLIVMVTHNRELATSFADRILEMKDGEIISDSFPIQKKEAVIASKSDKKRSTMSFAASVSTSMRSIRSKFWRVSLNSIATSIGLIGVGLVLSISVGFSNYVSTIESSLASTVPLSLSPTVYASNGSVVTPRDGEQYPDDNQVHIYNGTSSSYVAHKNNFTTEYVEYVNAIMEDPNCPAYGEAMSVMINRTSYDYHFLTKDGLNGEHYRRLDQYRHAGSTASAMSSYSNLPTTVLHEIYGDEDKLDGLYDVIYGRFPKNENELVLIVDKYNRIEFDALRSLGIINSKTQFADLSEEERQVDFSSIVADDEMDTDCAVYRCYLPSDYYQVGVKEPVRYSCDIYEDVHYDVMLDRFIGTPSTKECLSYTGADKAGIDYPYDEVYLNEEGIYHPIECKVVGVIRPSQQSFQQLMPASIGYTRKLASMMASDTSEGGAGYPMAKAQADNWFVPRIIKADGNPAANDGLEILNSTTLSIVHEFQSKTPEEVLGLMTSSYLTNAVNGAIQYLNAMSTYNPVSGVYTSTITTGVSAFLSWCHSHGAYIDTRDVPPMGMTTDCVSEWLELFLMRDFFSDKGEPTVVQALAYLNAYSNITGILIFPSTMASKAALISYLDAWNLGKIDADCIVYVDIMSDVTASLTALITMISAVLTGFAVVSIVVASIMTSITTYISVVERKREIGLLRACGGRKVDVMRLFETENATIGLFSGLIGVLGTYLLCFPANAFVKYRFPSYVFSEIAVMYPWIALVVLGLSVVLGLIGGLIPAIIAARKDPVECLRSE